MTAYQEIRICQSMMIFLQKMILTLNLPKNLWKVFAKYISLKTY